MFNLEKTKAGYRLLSIIWYERLNKKAHIKPLFKITPIGTAVTA